MEIGKLLMGDAYHMSSTDKDMNDLGKMNGMTLPMFPFNTDGIDIHATNVLIERLNITNYDDAVAVKPCTKNYKLCSCTENVLVQDCNMWASVGMSIGSVTPSDEYACVRNVTFINHRFHHPAKAVYIKTNPGTTETMAPGSGGEITGITYENIYSKGAVWWPIYIGP